MFCDTAAITDCSIGTDGVKREDASTTKEGSRAVT